jgi:hypothetical protein
MNRPHGCSGETATGLPRISEVPPSNPAITVDMCGSCVRKVKVCQVSVR